MQTLETTRQLIREMAANATEIDEIHESQDGTWGFGFTDESVMTAEWADQPPRLVLTFFLGAPPEGSRIQAYELLLTFNQMSAETGGVRGGMTPDRELTLVYDLVEVPSNEVEFRQALMNFAELGRDWSQTIRHDVATLEIQAPAIAITN